MTLTPRPYQLEGRDFLAKRSRALLGDQMRVGKSCQAIMAAEKRGAQSVLVVCPAIAREHWHREFRKWWGGAILPRLKVWSYDEARGNWQAGLRGSIDVFIPDECHFAKNPNAERTKMVYGRDGFGSRAGAIWPLSGTPVTKHAAELWPMLRAFGVVGCTYDEFVRAYCTVNPLTLSITGTKKHKAPELNAMLTQVMLRRTRKQVAPEMPEIAYDFLEIQPERGTPDLKVGALMGDDELLEMTEAHSAACAEDRQAVAFAKVGALVDEITFAIDNGLLRQTVVFGWHTDPLMVLDAELCRRGIVSHIITGQTRSRQRELTQRLFHDGVVQVVCANILAAGTAIDLSPASHGYFLELDWLPANNVQAANRLVSMDKSEPVTMDVCTWPGSTDDRIQQVLVRRMSEIRELGLA